MKIEPAAFADAIYARMRDQRVTYISMSWPEYLREQGLSRGHRSRQDHVVVACRGQGIIVVHGLHKVVFVWDGPDDAITAPIPGRPTPHMPATTAAA